jgi:D-aminoacyl-tRNA deacylase
MRAVVQRVSQARVAPGGEIGVGICVLLGVARGDGAEQAVRLAGKIARLRIFPDDEGRFDRSVEDVAGAVLVVSQFTLIADTAKGNRRASPRRRRRRRLRRSTSASAPRCARSASRWRRGSSARRWRSSS